MSGVYDVSVVGWGERGDAVYFNNPVDYVRHLNGEHLDWLRSHASLLLVCGQGQWEDTTGALESTKHFAGLLGEKGIPHELDLWGHDVPHDWPSWRAQMRIICLALSEHHLDRAPPRHGGGLAGGVRGAGLAGSALSRGTRSTTERIINEPFDLRAKPRLLARHRPARWWYDLPREWLKKVSLMDDVYLLNNPFTFQAMEKHSAYVAMMRLGLKVPATWMVPHKLPTPIPRFECMVEVRRWRVEVQRAFDLEQVGGADRLSALHEAVRRRPVGGRHADRERRRAAARATTSRASG